MPFGVRVDGETSAESGELLWDSDAAGGGWCAVLAAVASVVVGGCVAGAPPPCLSGLLSHEGLVPSPGGSLAVTAGKEDRLQAAVPLLAVPPMV